MGINIDMEQWNTMELRPFNGEKKSLQQIIQGYPYAKDDTGSLP